jgi:hypothetical protein
MRISSAEAVVMEVLWRKGALGADEIVAALGRRQDWSDKTVKTLLNRLLTKKAIAATRDGRPEPDRPSVRRQACPAGVAFRGNAAAQQGRRRGAEAVGQEARRWQVSFCHCFCGRTRR